MNRAGSWWRSAHWHLAPMDTPIPDRVKLYEGPQLVADSGVIIDTSTSGGGACILLLPRKHHLVQSPVSMQW